MVGKRPKQGGFNGFDTSSCTTLLNQRSINVTVPPPHVARIRAKSGPNQGELGPMLVEFGINLAGSGQIWPVLVKFGQTLVDVDRFRTKSGRLRAKSSRVRSMSGQMWPNSGQNWHECQVGSGARVAMFGWSDGDFGSGCCGGGSLLVGIFCFCSASGKGGERSVALPSSKSHPPSAYVCRSEMKCRPTLAHDVGAIWGEPRIDLQQRVQES